MTDRDAFLPYRTSLSLLQTVMKSYPGDFEYKEPPYEYEYEQLPMDCILGDQEVRLELEAGKTPEELEIGWQAESAEFMETRSRYLLY